MRASGPTTFTSSAGSPASSACPRTGTTPQVGLCPYTPQKCAGIRIEPLLSLPTSSALKPAASALAEPPDEPPGERVASHGLTVAP